MSRSLPAILVAALSVTWALNLAITTVAPAGPELYPMTAWPMFSHALPEHVITYELWVQPTPDATWVALPASLAFDPEHELDPNDTGTIMGAIAGGYRRGCADDVLTGQCPGQPRPGWRLPGDLAERWPAVAAARLGLDATPQALALTVVKTPVDGGAPDNDVLFTHIPTEGPSVRDGEVL